MIKNSQSLNISKDKKETLAQVFSYEFCEISKNTFSHRTPPVAPSTITAIFMITDDKILANVRWIILPCSKLSFSKVLIKHYRLHSIALQILFLYHFMSSKSFLHSHSKVFNNLDWAIFESGTWVFYFQFCSLNESSWRSLEYTENFRSILRVFLVITNINSKKYRKDCFQYLD